MNKKHRRHRRLLAALHPEGRPDYGPRARAVHELLDLVEGRAQRHRLLAAVTRLDVVDGGDGGLWISLETVVKVTEKLLRDFYGPSEHLRMVLDHYSRNVLWNRVDPGTASLNLDVYGASFRRLWGTPPTVVMETAVTEASNPPRVPLAWVRRVLLWALKGVVCVQFGGGLGFVLTGEAARYRYAFLRPTAEAKRIGAGFGVGLSPPPVFWTRWRDVPVGSDSGEPGELQRAGSPYFRS